MRHASVRRSSPHHAHRPASEAHFEAVLTVLVGALVAWPLVVVALSRAVVVSSAEASAAVAVGVHA